MLVCVGIFGAFAGAAEARADGLEVHFLDIGRNDGILIRCGGEDAFIDAGGYSRGREATEYMKSVGVSSLKYYIGTHAHDDHVGGAPVIIEAFRPETVLQPHDRVKETIFDNIRSTPQKTIVPETDFVNMKVGDQVRVGGATLTCLGPLEIMDVSPASGTENNNSLVLMLSYGEVDILLAADATNSSLLAIDEANPGCLKADVYKNAHHNQATRESVLQLIQPEYTIFSTAKNRLPDTSYMSLLNQYGSKALATAPNYSGDIILRTDGQDIQFETQYKLESLSLNQTAISVYEGKTARIRAATRPSGRTKLLSWTSSNPSVATVTADGKITGVSQGEAVITVSSVCGAEASCRVTVSPATMTLRKTELSVKQGSKVSASWKIQPSGSKPTIEWASADEKVATVDEKGRITGVYPGQTTITATMPSGQVSALTITVKPISVSQVTIRPTSVKMTLGETKSVTASVSPKNATWPEVTWSSADESIAVITQDGLIRAVGVGQTTIAATTREGKTRTAKVTVNPVYVKKIALSGAVEGLIGGVTGRNQAQLSYSIEPANATIQDVEWSSSNKKIATVDENGVVTGLKDGKVTITCKATDGSRRYARIQLTFAKNELVRSVIEPVEGELIARASRIRYSSNQLEIRMTYVNRTGQSAQVPEQGMLAFVTPEGDQIPLMPALTGRQSTLRHRSTRTITYKIPLSANARLSGLDLSRCDAVIVTAK